MVSGKLLPGKFSPIKLPPGEFPPGTIPLRKFPPGKFPSMSVNIPTHVFKFFCLLNVTIVTVVNYNLPVGSECFLSLKFLMRNVMLLNSVNLI